MRGQDAQQAQIFGYMSAEERLPPDHPFDRSARWWTRHCSPPLPQFSSAPKTVTHHVTQNRAMVGQMRGVGAYWLLNTNEFQCCVH